MRLQGWLTKPLHKQEVYKENKNPVFCKMGFFICKFIRPILIPYLSPMKFNSTVLLYLLCIACQYNYAQQTPKTLLWRITGNNFTQPSYLFGTMHSGDRRVYFLGDSVYSALEYCDGFVMEVDPGESLDTAINLMENRSLEVAYKDAVEGDLVKNKENDFKTRYARYDSMMNKLRERYKDMSQRDWARLERAYRRRDRNNMYTTLDVYLFDLAKKQGKLVGGIEDIAGRDAIRDELGNNFDPDEFLKNQRKKYADIEEWIILNYTDAELDKLHEFSKQGQTARQLSIVLYNRNNLMAERLDSLGRIRSTFCAVGTAHLPGDSGVIDILRKKGFTVTPVFSSKKIDPRDAKINSSLSELISISDVDSNYVVQMPGKPTDLIQVTNKLYVRAYKELANDILLMCGVNEDGNMNNSIEKEYDQVKKLFSLNDVKIYNTEKIKRQDLNGYDISFKSPIGYFRMHLFHTNGKTYVFAIGSKSRDTLSSERCKNYLNSYRMILDKEVTEQKMTLYSNPAKAFSVLLPSVPKIENIKGDKTYTKEDVTLFSSYDLKNKVSYLVMVKEPFKGYFMDFDSSIFKQTLSQVKKDVYEEAAAEEVIMLDGYPALKVRIKGKADNKSQIIYTVLSLRQNRLYNLTARGLAVPENEKLFDKFFNSFEFLPYLKTAFTNQSDKNNIFYVDAPSPMYIQHNTHAALGMRIDYFAVDSNSAMTYGITSIGFNKYYWAPDENNLLTEFARFQFNDSLAVNHVYNSDSLVYSKDVVSGTLKGKELLIKSLYNNTYTRLKILHYADSVFILNIKGDNKLVTDKNADNFFSSFRFNNEKYSTGVFDSKTQLLIKDLQSGDTVLRNAAAGILANGYKFPVQDILLFANAMLYNYPQPAPSAGDIPGLIARILSPYTNGVLIDFIKQNYPLFKGKREDTRMLMVNVLSGSGNRDAYQILKNILISDPPDNDDFHIAMADFRYYPETAATLFPDIAASIKNERIALFVIDIANTLIDSGRIQYSSFASYEEDILKLGKKTLKLYQEKNNDNFQLPHINGLLQLLSHIKAKQARNIQTEFLELRNNNLTPVIIVSLIKNNIPVSASVIDNYCKTPLLQIELYDDFVSVNRQSFFKGEYASQESFAKAFVSIYTDNEVPGNIAKYYEVAAIKDAVVNKVMSRFYIFKITCQYRRDTDIYTGIIGPFATDNSSLSIKPGDEVFILHRSKFDTGKLDSYFESFINQVKKIKEK